ncbi:MAG: hypothetical protein WEE89_19795 [Gemmatimonadota bacterium]
MNLLPLLLLLQIPGVRVTATAADTAFAQQALTRGLFELEQIGLRRGGSELDSRYVDQLSAWGMNELAWNRAVHFDTLRDRSSFYLLARTVSKLDSTALQRRLASLPPDLREPVLAAVAAYVAYTRPDLATRLAGQIASPIHRSSFLRSYYRSQLSRRDSAGARASLRTAIALLRDQQPTRELRAQIPHLLLELRRLGEPIPVAELIRSQMEIYPNGPWARITVASELRRAGEIAEARLLADSALLMVAADTGRVAQNARASALELRSNAGDSAQARLIRDSLNATTPDQSFRTQQARNNAIRALSQAVYRNDSGVWTQALRNALALDDSVVTLLRAASDTQRRLESTFSPYSGVESKDSVFRFADQAFELLWRESARLPAVARDSVRVGIIAIQAPRNARAALGSADSLRTPRMRDRALAHGLRWLARVDADDAATRAAPIRDADARNLVYLELTTRALGGGRLAAASTLANRTAHGTSRLRAQLMVAAAELDAGRTQAARDRLIASLPMLDPVRQCGGCVQVVTPGRPLPVAEGMEAGLIDDFIKQIYRMDRRAELHRWATQQSTALKRANAWLVVAEGLGYARLGRRPSYPVY